MPDERTRLSDEDEAGFQEWVHTNRRAPGVGNHDDPSSKYDMRGFYKDKAARAQWKPGDHFPDTYKQHGHPLFSAESKYSRGPQDGGQWMGDTLVDPPTASHISAFAAPAKKARR
jgi:hypothetical protein